MSQKPTHASGVKEQQGVDHDDAITRGASGGEGEKCKDKNDVRGGSHHDVQEDTGEDSGLVKEDDEVYQDYGDASNLKGATSSETQAAIESKSSNVVSAADLLDGLSLDGSAPLFLQQQEQAVGDEQVGDQQHVVNASQDWSVLTEEVVLMLFKFYLKPGDVLAASQTCRRWRILGENDQLWKKKCQEAGLAYTLNPADLKIVKRRTKETTIDSPWKVNFLKQFKIERKFRQGVPHVLTIERSHYVHQLEVFNDKLVCSTGTTPTLYVFSALSGVLLHELVGHTAAVWTFQMDEKIIVSGSQDESLKVWDVASGSCLRTMLGHTGGVTCLEMHGLIAISGSHDGTLRMWDVREGTCIRILSRHTRDVSHVQFDRRLVVSGSRHNTIKIWDRETGECLRTMNHDAQIHTIKFNGTDVVAGYGDMKIKVWDVNNGVCRQTLFGRSSNQWMMELQGNSLACGGDDDKTTAEVWSISNSARLSTLDGPEKHSSYITGIRGNQKFVVTSSFKNDGPLKLWDKKTGEFIRDLLGLESGQRVKDMWMNDAKIVCFVPNNGISKILVLNFDTNDKDYEVSDEEVKTG